MKSGPSVLPIGPGLELGVAGLRGLGQFLFIYHPINLKLSRSATAREIQ